jgi:hypothetical protein
VSGDPELGLLAAFAVSDACARGVDPLVDEAWLRVIKSTGLPGAKRRAERYLAAAIAIHDRDGTGSFDPTDRRLQVASYAFVADHTVTMARHWIAQGALEKTDRVGLSIRPTWHGRMLLDDLETSRRATSQCFVAMSFSEEMRSTFDQGIDVAVRNSGYEALRLDRSDDDGKVDDRIIAEMRRSAFMVADFTEHRGGVYYEAGFAHGLSLRVLFTCRKDHLDGLHFDVRQYDTIAWEAPADLADRLQNRILALFGAGPHNPDAKPVG